MTTRYGFTGLAVIALATASACATSHSPTRTISEAFAPIEQRMLTAIVDTLMRELPAAGVVCLLIDDRNDFPLEPDADFLSDLSTDRVVLRSECPETYATWIQSVDSLGHPLERIRPEGQVDPFHLRLTRLRFDAEGSVSTTALASQGTRGQTHDCTCRVVGDTVEVVCEFLGRWIS